MQRFCLDFIQQSGHIICNRILTLCRLRDKFRAYSLMSLTQHSLLKLATGSTSAGSQSHLRRVHKRDPYFPLFRRMGMQRPPPLHSSPAPNPVRISVRWLHDQSVGNSRNLNKNLWTWKIIPKMLSEHRLSPNTLNSSWSWAISRNHEFYLSTIFGKTPISVHQVP